MISKVKQLFSFENQRNLGKISINVRKLDDNSILLINHFHSNLFTLCSLDSGQFTDLLPLKLKCLHVNSDVNKSKFFMFPHTFPPVLEQLKQILCHKVEQLKM